MARRLTTIVAALWLTACAVMPNKEVPTTFETACYWTETIGYEIDCSTISPPTVVVSNIVTAWQGPGTYGLYMHGEPFVFIAEGLSDTKTREVVIHETVHYLLWETYGGGVGRCEGEEAARLATDLAYGRDYDPAWKRWYGC